MSISGVSTVSLHHRTNDQKLLCIIHRNKTFSSRSNTKIRVRIIHDCVLYTEKYGISLKININCRQTLAATEERSTKNKLSSFKFPTFKILSPLLRICRILRQWRSTGKPLPVCTSYIQFKTGLNIHMVLLITYKYYLYVLTEKLVALL